MVFLYLYLMFVLVLTGCDGREPPPSDVVLHNPATGVTTVCVAYATPDEGVSYQTLNACVNQYRRLGFIVVKEKR